MNIDFDHLPDRRGTESAKWHCYEDDVLPMWVADMDFRSPEPVVRALEERVAHGVFGYPDDDLGLRTGIVAWLANHHGWNVQPEDIVFTPGVVSAVHMAGYAYVGDGKGVLIQTPVYMPFLKVARNVHGIAQEMELTHHPDGYYTIDWNAFEQAITDQTAMFLLCNPHNPVGRVFTRGELERMANTCLRRNVLICSDEIHSDLVYSGHQHIPVASLSPEIAQQTVTLMAPSKTFNIAGLHCSFAIIQNAELRRKFVQGGRGIVHGVNLLGQVAAKAAYAEGQAWLDQLMVYLQGNLDLLCRFVEERLPGVRMYCPEATYLAWLDCREAGIGDHPGDFFLKQARVAVNEGDTFGKGGEGFVRLNFGCPRPMLVEALERMQQALEER